MDELLKHFVSEQLPSYNHQLRGILLLKTLLQWKHLPSDHSYFSQSCSETLTVSLHNSFCCEYIQERCMF